MYVILCTIGMYSQYYVYTGRVIRQGIPIMYIQILIRAMEYSNREFAEKLSEQQGTTVVNNLNALKGIMTNSSDAVSYSVGDVIAFPKEYDVDGKQIQIKKFGEVECPYIVLPNKQVYLSTFTKRVKKFDPETKESLDETVSANNDVFNWARQFANAYDLAVALQGRVFKVVKVNPVCTCKYNNAGEVTGTRVTKLPYFEDITPKES